MQRVTYKSLSLAARAVMCERIDVEVLVPYRASAPCSFGNCAALAVRAGRCAEHQRKQAERNEAPRESPSVRGYDANWNHIRARFLKENPWCEQCDQPSSEAHHVVEIRNGGTHSEDNLMALCKPCHSRITAQRHGWKGARR